MPAFDNMHSLRLYAFLAFVAVIRCYDLSPTLAEFYCAYSGVFTNKEQVETDATNRTLIYFKVVAIEIPALSQLPVLYLEQASDGALVLMELGVVTEAPDGVVYLDPYNFPGNTGHHEPGSFDPANLNTLTWDQVQLQEDDCRDVFTRVRPLTFDLNWTDCRQPSVKGSRHKLKVTLTCDSITAVFPKGFRDIPTPEPYLLKLQGHKFQLPSAPNDYVCNCGNTCSSRKH